MILRAVIFGGGGIRFSQLRHMKIEIFRIILPERTKLLSVIVKIWNLSRKEWTTLQI